MRFNWTFDQVRQVLHSPGGYSVSVKQIATQLQDKIASNYDFSGAWAGWRMRGGVLIGPGGQRLKPDQLRAQGRHAEGEPGRAFLRPAG